MDLQIYCITLVIAQISVREFCLLAYPGKDAGSVFEAMDLDSSNSISLQEFTHYVAFHKQRHGDVAAALVSAATSSCKMLNCCFVPVARS